MISEDDTNISDVFRRLPKMSKDVSNNSEDPKEMIQCSAIKSSVMEI